MPKHNKGFVFFNEILAGELNRLSEGYSFKYDESYLVNEKLPQIAHSFPKQKEPFFSERFFPFFYGMLSEGSNREIQERLLKIDSSDHFSLLVETAQTETIGAITVRDKI
ncbi:MAG: HipA N-terminal domain-containing protein [Fibromonadales bacterium]|nr:HipA N-terminal domain-containing protein [Fibromonadales bacterium]